jgi:xanthine dehydrogenase YagT iron-sulfur-binding subunit
MTDSKQDRAGGGFDRRAFLRGSGAVAAATAIQADVASAAPQTTLVAAGQKEIKIEVNGKQHSLNVETRETLLDVLRYHLDLTGAKPVSADGSSGASTVLLNGKPAMASTVLAVTCDGKKVTTVEGLDDRVPAAFVAADAQQCGFCTPGFVVAVKAFLDKQPNATEEEIRQGLNGNICRCGTYTNIVQAVVSLVKGGNNG